MKRPLTMNARNRNSRGFILVWTAVLLTVMMLMAALSVDLGFWYRNKNQAQQAADAAAAAGVIYRSITGVDDFTAAEAAAKEAASRNGFNASEVLVSRFNEDATPRVQLPENQLYVRITRESPNFFLSILGSDWDKSTVTARSIAEYEPPLAIGSPCNGLGRQPGPDTAQGTLCEGGANSSLMWLDIHGPKTPVYNGDQYSDQDCSPTTNTPPKVPAVCVGGVNQSWLKGGQSGYEYVVRVLPDGVGKVVNVDAFDPAFTATGPGCQDDPATRLNIVANAYNTQASQAYNAYLAQLNALNQKLAQFNNNLAWIDDRIDDLIGRSHGGTVAAPNDTRLNVPSQLKDLKPTATSTQVLGFYTAMNGAYQRVWELEHSASTLAPLFWGIGPPNGTFWGTYANSSYNGTSFYHYQAGIPILAEHGNFSTTNFFPNPVPPVLQQHDSAIDLLSLESRIQGFRNTTQTAINNLAAVSPPTLISAALLERFKAHDRKNAGDPAPDLPYCSGDTSFGAAYNLNRLAADCVACGGGDSNSTGMPAMNEDRKLTSTATYTPRPTTQFEVLQPGQSSDLVDGVTSCRTRFGGYTESRDKTSVPPAGSGAAYHTELFRILATELHLTWQPGMNSTFWTWMLYGAPGGGLGDAGVPTVEATDAGLGHGFAETFHSWVNICSFIPAAPGDYRIRVTTDINPDGTSGSLSIGGNRFALRATSPTDSGKNLRIFGKNKMNLMLNAAVPGSPDNAAFVTEVIPAGFDRTLDVTFHDPGDLRGCRLQPKGPGYDYGSPVVCALSGSSRTYSGGDLRFLGWTADMSSFSETLALNSATSNGMFNSCRYSYVVSPSESDFSAAVSPCAIPGLTGAGTNPTNGGLLTVRFDLPASNKPGGYNCTSGAASLDCWLKGNFTFPAAPAGLALYAEDVTTWSVDIKGDPLRFVGS